MAHGGGHGGGGGGAHAAGGGAHVAVGGGGVGGGGGVHIAEGGAHIPEGGGVRIAEGGGAPAASHAELHTAREGPHYEGPPISVGVGAPLGPGIHVGVGVGFNPHPEFVVGEHRDFRRCTYGPTFGVVRRCSLRLAIGRRAILPLAFGVSLAEVMIIYDARLGTYRCAEAFDPPPCAFNGHVIVTLPEYTEITFQDPTTMQTRIYYADSYCSVCGQHFFIESTGFSNTIVAPVAVVAPMPVVAPMEVVAPMPVVATTVYPANNNSCYCC